MIRKLHQQCGPFKGCFETGWQKCLKEAVDKECMIKIHSSHVE